MAMLNAARKARIQGYLDKDLALQQAAQQSKRYTEPTRDQPQHSDPLMHGLILAVARDRFPDLGQPDTFSEFSRKNQHRAVLCARCCGERLSQFRILNIYTACCAVHDGLP